MWWFPSLYWRGCVRHKYFSYSCIYVNLWLVFCILKHFICTASDSFALKMHWVCLSSDSFCKSFFFLQNIQKHTLCQSVPVICPGMPQSCLHGFSWHKLPRNQINHPPMATLKERMMYWFNRHWQGNIYVAFTLQYQGSLVYTTLQRGEFEHSAQNLGSRM